MTSSGSESDNQQETLKRVEPEEMWLSGLISTGSTDLRAILDEVLSKCGHIPHGVLRLMSKSVRGNISISNGAFITGGHATNTNEYGTDALSRLLAVPQGMYAFLIMKEQPLELCQDINLSIYTLLEFNSAGNPEKKPSLVEAMEKLLGLSDEAEVAQSDDSITSIDVSTATDRSASSVVEDFFMGPDAPAAIKNTLSRWNLFPSAAAKDKSKITVEIERIPIPEDVNQDQTIPPGRNFQPMEMPNITGTYQKVSTASAASSPTATGGTSSPSAAESETLHGAWSAGGSPADNNATLGTTNNSSSGPNEARVVSNAGTASVEIGVNQLAPQRPAFVSQAWSTDNLEAIPTPVSAASGGGTASTRAQQNASGASQQSRDPHETQDIPMRRPHPNETQDIPLRRPNPNETQDIPLRRRDPNETQDVPLRRPDQSPTVTVTGLQQSLRKQTDNMSRDQMDAIPSPRATGSHLSVSARLRQQESETPDQLAVSQRMKAAPDLPPPVNAPILRPHETKPIGPLFIAGVIAGFIMTILLCKQVIEINKWESEFRTGLDAIKQKNDTTAIVALTGVIRQRPDSARAYFYRGLAAARIGDPKKAISDFTKVISLERNNMLAYAGRASARIKNMDFDGAILDCDSMEKIDAQNPDSHRLRAVALSRNSKFKESVDEATAYLQGPGKTDSAASQSDVLSVRGYGYYKLKNYEQALNDYTAAIELNPKGGALYASRAIVNRELHNWSGALADADKAAALDPNDTSVFKLRGLCYQAQGDSTRALAELDRAVKLTPTVSLYKMRGKARLDVREFVGAMQDFDYVLGVAPDDKEAKVLYDRALLNVRNPEKAPNPPTKISPVAPQAVIAPSVKAEGGFNQLLNNGFQMLKKGSADDAVTLLQAAVQKNPNSLEARRYLAYALIGTGDEEAACNQFAALEALGGLQSADRSMYQQSIAKRKAKAAAKK